MTRADWLKRAYMAGFAAWSSQRDTDVLAELVRWRQRHPDAPDGVSAAFRRGWARASLPS